MNWEHLRAERNRKHREWVEQMQAEGYTIQHSSHDDNACYCSCGQSGENGGLCEHHWDGPAYTSDDGLMQSATCGRCGVIAFCHDMRVMP